MYNLNAFIWGVGLIVTSSPCPQHHFELQPQLHVGRLRGSREKDGVSEWSVGEIDLNLDSFHFLTQICFARFTFQPSTFYPWNNFVLNAAAQ